LPGSVSYPLGTDAIGRDMLSRLIYGARLSLLIGIVAVSVGLSIGVVLGSIAGFFGGWVDTILMRFVDIMLAIPGFLMAIGIVALLGPGLFQVMIAIGVVNIPIFTRLLRARYSRNARTTSCSPHARSEFAAARFSSRTCCQTRSRS
jgi:dipeptide transport system permease protein